MTDQEIDTWAKDNCCKFCQWSKVHTCALGKCAPAIEKAREYKMWEVNKNNGTREK